MDKRLYRSSTNKVVAGVCGGLGEYLAVDPVFVRIFAVLLAVTGHGLGFLAYIVAWIIVPKQEESVVEEVTRQKEMKLSTWNTYVPGLIMIGIGLLLIARESWFWFDWDEFWPIALIAAGLFLIFRRKRKPATSAEPNGPVELNGRQPKTENGGSVS